MTEEGVFHHPLVVELLEKARVLWALGHAMSLMSWDLETNMPGKGVTARSEAFSNLAVLQRNLLLRDEIVKTVDKLSEGIEELDDYEKGVVRVLSREIRIARALPEELVAKLAKVTSEATRIWSEAKKRNDFDRFRPHLEEIMKLVREKAERLGYDQHPYDALLDLYEEGLRTRDVEEIFSSLVPATRRMLDKVLSDDFYPRKHPLEDSSYDPERARELMEEILLKLGWDWNRGRLDESPHPFTMGLDVDDVRITTRYEGKDIRRALYSVIHEFGHALYELQIDHRIAMTPIGGGVSLGVHESQSRFWENMIGRSHWFLKGVEEIIAKYLGAVAEHNWLELYRYVNTVRPDLVRVDADELTYNLHIYLRFQLEKRLISGDAQVGELPELWDSGIEELLGIRPKNYSEGVLQDIHWSHGSIGYFPTYTLGNLIAAQVWGKMRSEIDGLPELVEKLDLQPIRRWLRDRIHRWGATYPPSSLIQRVLGERPSTEHITRYFEWKYLKLPDELRR